MLFTFYISILPCSEIPDLFPDDEVENIVGGLRNEVKNAGMTDTRDNCWRFFIERVRKQLKVSCIKEVGMSFHDSLNR